MQRASLSGVMAGRREWRAGHERWAGKCASARQRAAPGLGATAGLRAAGSRSATRSTHVFL